MEPDELDGTFRFDGTVVDAEGAPAANIEVRLKPGDKQTRTDAQGAFAFEGLASHRFWVSARDDEFYAGPTVVRIVESTEPVLLHLSRGSTFVVHVIADGAPIAGATVTLQRDDLTAITDADGVAKICGLTPEDHDGVVLADGWAPAHIAMFLDTDPGGVIEQHVTLRPGASVEGVVLGPGDQPVSDTEIVVWRAVEGSFVNSATSAADGSWRIDALEAGRFRVVATSNAYCSTGDQILECDGQTPRRDIVIRVDVGAEVFGSVLEKSGERAAGVHIDANLYGAGGKRSVTDEFGRFQIRALEPGEYYIDACTPTKASQAAHLHLEVGKPVEITLVLDDARVAGIVTDNKGELVINATVQAVPCEIYVPYRLQVTTDSRGRFDLGPLQLGEYDLYLNAPNTRRRDETPTMRVRSGQSDLRLVLEPTSAITGRVVFDGSAMPYFGASLAGEDDAPREVGIREIHGRFTLPVDPGTWRLKLLGPGTALVVKEGLAVGPGQVLDLGDVAMERGQRISGRVRDVNGAPVANARVRIGPGSNLNDDKPQLKRWFEGEYEVSTDEVGSYSFDGVGEPDYWGVERERLIAATHPSRGASLVKKLAQDDVTLDFLLLRSGTIEGSVDGAAGRHRFVDLLRADEPPRARWIGTRGDFCFENVPEGEYEAKLFGGNEPGPITSARFTVIAGQCTKLNLVMVSATVELTIKVPRGRGNDLVIEREEGSTRAPVNVMMIMDDSVALEDVEPGSYRVSLDGNTWVPIEVRAVDPPELTFVFPTKE